MRDDVQPPLDSVDRALDGTPSRFCSAESTVLHKRYTA